MQTTELRPLGAGEMLDRAITLFVRWFGPIVAVIAVVTVPLTILQAIVDPQAGSVFGDFAKLLSTMGDPVGSRHAAETIARNDRTSPVAYAVVMLGVIVRALQWGALVRLVADAYGGTRTSIGTAYRFALRRWFPQLIVGLAFLVIGMLLAIPVLVLYIVVVLVVFGFAAVHQPVPAIAAGVAGGLVVFAAAIVLEAIVFMTYELAAVAILTETANPIDAITIGLRRGLARGMKRRSLVGGIVVFLVSQAGLLPFVGIAILLTTTTHVSVLYFAVLGVGSLLLDGIIATFVVVFAVDARVRREGYDLFAQGAPLAP